MSRPRNRSRLRPPDSRRPPLRRYYQGADVITVTLPLILDCLVQSTGAVMFTVGMTSHKQVLVRGPAPAANTTPRIRFSGNRIAIEGRF